MTESGKEKERICSSKETSGFCLRIGLRAFACHFGSGDVIPELALLFFFRAEREGVRENRQRFLGKGGIEEIPCAVVLVGFRRGETLQAFESDAEGGGGLFAFDQAEDRGKRILGGGVGIAEHLTPEGRGGGVVLCGTACLGLDATAGCRRQAESQGFFMQGLQCLFRAYPVTQLIAAGGDRAGDARPGDECRA